MPKKNDDTPLNLLKPTKPNDWFIYHVFYIAAQSRTLDEAAKTTGFSGTYISQTIDKLENALEVKLIVRGVNHLKLTKTGKEIYQRLKLLQDGFEDIRCYVERSKHGYTESPLSLAAPLMLAEALISPFMKEFSEKHPEARFYLDSYKYYEIDQLYQADCALILGEPKRQSYCADYLYTSKTGIYASKEYLKKNGMPKTLDEMIETGDIISRHQEVDISTPKSSWLTAFINNHEAPGIVGKNIQFISDNVLKHKGFGLLSNGYTLGNSIQRILPEETKNAKENRVYFIYPREHKSYKSIIALKNFLLKITEPLR